MRRALFLVPLLLLATAAAALPTTAERFGKLVRIHGGKVWGQPDQSARAEMREGQDVGPRMEVSTERTSVGKIALKSRCSGAITLGPDSRFWFGDEAPEPCKWSFALAAGQIRFVFSPVVDDPEVRAVLGVEPHEVQIDTPNAHISISGSDVYVWFDEAARSTWVYVQEGRAEVTAGRATVRHAGGGAASAVTVEVRAGEMTVARDGGGPPAQPSSPYRPPHQIFPQLGSLPYHEPPLDLRNPRLDLPK